VDEIRERVGEWLRGIGEGRFAPTPGDHCRWCDFLSFCATGRHHLAAAGEVVPPSARGEGPTTETKT